MTVRRTLALVLGGGRGTRLFPLTRDRSRNRWNADDEVLEVSSIFDWYSGDFEKGFLGADSVEAFLALYVADLGLDARVAKALREGDVDLDYTDYDWRLNRAE